MLYRMNGDNSAHKTELNGDLGDEILSAFWEIKVINGEHNLWYDTNFSKLSSEHAP